MQTEAAKRPLVSRPVLARVAPFAVYMAFLAVEDVARQWLGDALDPRWLYPVKIVAVILTLLYFRRDYTELTLKADSRAWTWGVPVGLLVFVLWINLDWGWLNLGDGPGYDPRTADGGMDWTLVAMRIFGAALVVPVMEELFWRSFLMRWIDHHDFRDWEPARVGLRAILISSALFAVEHTLWFAGLLAGLAYAWLYRASGNLWTPIVSHATTNLALGLYVLYSGEWRFW
jgi:hypothetical protein